MRIGSCSLDKQFKDTLLYVNFTFNSISPEVFNPVFDPGVAGKNGHFPTGFFPNHKFYFTETFYEDSMPFRNFKNIEIWGLVT